MFIRQKFVTNSSSTSFIGFGVWIDSGDDNVIKIMKYLTQKYPKKAKEYLDDWDLPETEESFKKLYEEGEEMDFIYELLSGTGIHMEQTSDYDIFYLHIGLPSMWLDKDGTVMMDPKELQTGFHNLKDLLISTGLGNANKIGIVKDCWNG